MTLPKGLGPLLKEVLLTGFGPVLDGPHPGPRTERTGGDNRLEQAQRAGNGRKQVLTGPKWPKKLRLTLLKGREPVLKFSIVDGFVGGLAWQLTAVGGRLAVAAGS